MKMRLTKGTSMQLDASTVLSVDCSGVESDDDPKAE